MVARTGLFVAPVPGPPPVGTSPTDGRLVLGALFGTTGGCLSGGAFTTSGTLMQATIAPAVWRIPDPTNTGGVYLSPADTTTLTFSAGPASGSRIDAIWVRQNNYEALDADSRVTYGVTTGTATSSPTAPAIPAGAMKIGQLTVPTGASNAAACVLVPTYQTGTSGIVYAGTVTPYTSANDGMNLVRLGALVVLNLSLLPGTSGISNGSLLCTLPIGYRPAVRTRAFVPAFDGSAFILPGSQIKIERSGDVSVELVATGTGGSNGLLSGSIAFAAA
jgi:hypothetical protein